MLRQARPDQPAKPQKRIQTKRISTLKISAAAPNRSQYLKGKGSMFGRVNYFRHQMIAHPYIHPTNTNTHNLWLRPASNYVISIRGSNESPLTPTQPFCSVSFIQSLFNNVEKYLKAVLSYYRLAESSSCCLILFACPLNPLKRLHSPCSITPRLLSAPGFNLRLTPDRLGCSLSPPCWAFLQTWFDLCRHGLCAIGSRDGLCLS